jgi:hypothetical protein
MHSHANLDALSESLLTVLKNPSALTRLVADSRLGIIGIFTSL